jgi:hypothetical protein
MIGDKEKLDNINPRDDLLIFKSFGDSLERSIINGFSLARFYSPLIRNNFVVIDADGSHPISMISMMFDKLEFANLVVGSRWRNDLRNPWRNIVTKGFSFLAHFFAGSSLQDPMSGFFGVKSDTVYNMRFKLIKWKTCLEIELFHKYDENFIIDEVPIEFSDRKEGGAKSNYKVAFALAKDLIFYRWK